MLGAALSLGAAPAETDLDAFMRAGASPSRDDNWKKLQQYVFDEREQFDMRGPNRVPIWGERRDYTWFIRDGFFVRSPIKFNGVTIGEADRRKFEADYLKQAQERDKRRGAAATRSDSGVAIDSRRDAPAADEPHAGRRRRDRQTRQPQFISSAYFLRFKFEEGKYALVGRETLDGRDVLRDRVLPRADVRRHRSPPHRQGTRPTDDAARDAEFQRLMNKVALVTLWVEPKAHQIVKYTFDNVGFDFLPAQWLVHVSDVKATMTVGQPFPDVWLPTSLEINLAMTLALGQIDLRYGLDYHDYRVPSVTSKVGIK